MGGFCNSGYSLGQVEFDLVNPQAMSNFQLADKRLLLECYFRCFCNFGVADRTKKPRNLEDRGPYAVGYYSDHLVVSRLTTEITLDIAPSFTNTDLWSFYSPKGQQGNTLVPYARLVLGSQLPTAGHYYYHLSLNAANRVVCKG